MHFCSLFTLLACLLTTSFYYNFFVFSNLRNIYNNNHTNFSFLRSGLYDTFRTDHRGRYQYTSCKLHLLKFFKLLTSALFWLFLKITFVIIMQWSFGNVTVNCFFQKNYKKIFLLRQVFEKPIYFKPKQKSIYLFSITSLSILTKIIKKQL